MSPSKVLSEMAAKTELAAERIRRVTAEFGGCVEAFCARATFTGPSFWRDTQKVMPHENC